MGCGGRSSVKIATGIGTRPIKTGRDLGGRYRRAVLGNTTQQLRQLRHVGRDPPRLVSWPGACAKRPALSPLEKLIQISLVLFHDKPLRLAWLRIGLVGGETHAVVGNRLCITLPRFLDCRISLGIRFAARSRRRRPRGPASAPKNQWYDKNSGADAQRIREHWPDPRQKRSLQPAG